MSVLLSIMDNYCENNVIWLPIVIIFSLCVQKVFSKFSALTYNLCVPECLMPFHLLCVILTAFCSVLFIKTTSETSNSVVFVCFRLCGLILSLLTKKSRA